MLRDQCGRLPTNLLWALCASLLLHLFLLDLGLAFSRPDGARAANGVALSVTLAQAGAALESASLWLDDSVVAVGAIAGSSDHQVESFGADSSAAVRESSIADGVIGRHFFDRGVTLAIREELVPVAVPGKAAYFLRSELSRPPELLGEPEVDAQDETGRENHGSGKVLLRLFVSASGALDRAEIEGNESLRDVDEAALAAFLPLHFRPGEIDGVAVNSQVVFAIDFDAQARGRSRSSDQVPWLGD